MKKMLLACTAAGVMAVAVSASALCAQINVDNGATYAVDEAGKYTVSVAAEVLSGKIGQMTVLVTPKGALEKEGGLQDSDILYIDQLAAADGIFQDMGVKDALVEGSEYDVFIGGENVTNEAGEASFYRTSFKVGAGKQIKWCDIDGTGKVDANDVTRLLQHTTKYAVLEGYTDEELIALADVNKDGKVDANDVTRLLQHTTKYDVIPDLNY